MTNIVYLGLGSNKGNKKQYIEQAVDKLSNPPFRLVSKSTVIETAPYGFTEQDTFLNLVVKIETSLSPEELLITIKNIESVIGRKKTFRWGPREIDIDILFYNDLVYKSEILEIPHPEIHKRLFVLEPLCEIEADLVHPKFNLSISELTRKLKNL